MRKKILYLTSQSIFDPLVKSQVVGLSSDILPNLQEVGHLTTIFRKKQKVKNNE